MASAKVSERDLRILASIVSEDRPDVPAREGLPPSLLADLMNQIRSDVVAFVGFDSARRKTSSMQFMPDGGEATVADRAPVQWEYYGNCQLCSYPDRTGDLRSIVQIADFYSARQWHSMGTRCGINRPMGFEHALMLTLPTAEPVPETGQTMRLYFFRGPGPDFPERDRALLTLLRPHLNQAHLEAKQRRHPVPRLTSRQLDVLRLVAAGHTNAHIARQLGVAEGTVRKHLGNIYEKLGVSGRIAAIARAFPGLVAR
jgi:DNA-binding CsgD family transcriptional regulator